MPQAVEEVPKWATLIKTLRKRRFPSQQALADVLKSTQSNVAKWERGDYKPSPRVLMDLATIFAMEPETFVLMELAGVPKDFMEGKTDPRMVPSVMVDDEDLRRVPLLRDAAAAGTPRHVDEKEIERLLTFPKSWLPHGGRLYALPIAGDSMSPILLDGHIVIVDLDQRDPSKLVNEMVLASGDGVTVKWLYEDEGEYLLVPNHVSVRHPVRRLNRKGRDLKIIGHVVHWIGAPPPKPRRK